MFGILGELEILAARCPVPSEVRALLLTIREAAGRYEVSIAAPRQTRGKEKAQ